MRVLLQEPYRLRVPPPAVGGYRMADVRFMLTEKPSAWHRFWVGVVLGWVWEDAK